VTKITHNHTVPNSQLHQQPVDAVLRPTFIRKLCYKLWGVVAFTFVHIFDQNFVFFTEQVQVPTLAFPEH